MLTNWSDQDLQANPQEKDTLHNWLIPSTVQSDLLGTPRLKPCSPYFWYPPPQGSIKLNFHGALKGNPGQAGFGGDFRNNKGQILNIYYKKLGLERNNVT